MRVLCDNRRYFRSADIEKVCGASDFCVMGVKERKEKDEREN